MQDFCFVIKSWDASCMCSCFFHILLLPSDRCKYAIKIVKCSLFNMGSINTPIISMPLILSSVIGCTCMVLESLVIIHLCSVSGNGSIKAKFWAIRGFE